MSFPVLSFPFACAISTDLTVRHRPVRVCDINRPRCATCSGHAVRHAPIYAAAIAVQCYGQALDIFAGPYDGEGIAQISKKQVEKEYGEKVMDWLGYVRGCGLRYEGEDVHDHTDPVWAVEYMRRRIQQVLEVCDKCTSTDKFIAAALAQNGSGFTHYELTQTVLNKAPENPEDLYRYITSDKKIDFGRSDGVTVNWAKYFDVRDNYDDTYKQLNLFAQFAFELNARHLPTLSWYLPTDLNWNTIWALTTP